MSASSSKATGLWFCATVALGCAGVIAGVAWYRGSIDPLAWLRGNQSVNSPMSQLVPAPEKIEPDLDHETFEAQSEPEAEGEREAEPGIASTAGDRRHKSKRASDLFDGSDEDELGGSVETANFEEEAEAPPPATTTAPRNSGRTRDGVASAKGRASAERASQSVSDVEQDESRSAPLMSLEKIESLETDGDVVTAQHELSRWYWQKPAQREELLPRLNRMARALYFSPQPHYY